MGKIVKRNLPCKACSSSDARQLYEDLTSFCFSCQAWFPKDEEERELAKTPTPTPTMRPQLTVNNIYKKLDLDQIKALKSANLKDRKISQDVLKFFDVKVSFDSDGEIDTHYYYYDENSYKVRELPKKFSWLNKSSKLFGQTKFNPGGKRLIICEGEIDTLSVAQAYWEKYERIYPVVGLPSSVFTKTILENRDWVRSFQEVVLCFDEDDAGKKAVEEAIKYVGLDKVKIVKLPENDANDVLKKHNSYRLLQCIFDASKYVPSGIISKEDLWNALETYNSIPSVPYPNCLAGVNTKIKGMRTGEISLFISGTGSGKSTVLREIMLHILETTKDKIGVVALEETPAETARKLAGMHLNRNPAKEEISLEDLRVGFDKVFGDDRVVILDHQGAINDASIVDQLEYMCLVGCKYLFIDHITILVSEGVENLTGNEAQDKMMNELLKLVKRHPVWVGLVSHLRKSNNTSKSFEEGRLPSIDDIRGSGSIKQITFDIIAFARNTTSDNERERNSIKMRILKSRHTGLTGNVPGAYYDYNTGRLSALSDIVEEFVSL